MSDFPVDFEALAKMPPPPAGVNGYPYSLRGEDLMKNLEYAALEVDPSASDAIQLSITKSEGRRTLSAKINQQFGTGSSTFVDCEGSTVGSIEWVNGLITTAGSQTIESGCGGGGPRPFQASRSVDDGKISVQGGSYSSTLNSHADVAGISSASGSYVYARVKQDVSGNFVSFELSVDSSMKPPTETATSGTTTFVEYSNILLAEVVGSGGDARIVQRREGNLVLTTWVINGYAALWADTAGGTPL